MLGVEELAGSGLVRVIEFGTLAVALVLGGLLLVRARRAGRLGTAALLYVAGLSIFWQEFFADWGAYLAWSPNFAALPWDSTLWTTPHKPWFVIAAYPVFMCAAFSAMLALTRWSLRDGERPTLARCALTAGLPLIVINTALEYAAVSVGHLWTYVEVIGPALDAGAGQQPLLYPNLPFGAFGTVAVFLILRADRVEGGGRRVLSWVVAGNVCYWLLLCVPLIALRELFGPASAIVP